MTEIEYEYSFKVKALNPYIKYCEEEGYQKVEEGSQIRELFTSSNGVLARITTKETDNGVKTFLDFKDEVTLEKILKNSRETIPLMIKEEDREKIDSILDILNYKKKKHLVRKRYVYKKDKVIFELDEYSSPEKMFVVAIEGEKESVDQIYSYIKKNIGGRIG